MPFLASIEGQFGFGRASEAGIVTTGLQVNLDAGNPASYSGTGTTWTDLTGKGRNATLRNSPKYLTVGNGYLIFEDTLFQYANIPNIGSLPQYTMEAWVCIKTTLTGRITAIVCNQYDLVFFSNFCLGTIQAPGSVNICNGFYDTTWRTNTGFAPTLNTWYQIVGTYDGTTLRQYANAVAVGNAPTYSGTPQSVGEVRMMRRWDSTATDPNNFLAGNLSVVRIYNRALTQAEITQNYNAVKDRYTATPLAGSLYYIGIPMFLEVLPGITFGAGAYTFECWFYNNSSWPNTSGNFRSLIGSGPQAALNMFFNSSSSVTIIRGSVPFNEIKYSFAPTTITLNKWHHFAYVRNASLIESAFLDGVKATSCSGGSSISGGQQVNATNYTSSSFIIGDSTTQDIWAGYLTNMRIVVGTAVYNPTASSITVPNTGPLAVVDAPNTKYLMLGADILTDSSATQTVRNAGPYPITRSVFTPF
jgi:hypothetical protein